LLIIFAGLPGVGKTSLARALAQGLGAVFLRIDTIEQVLADVHADDIVRADPGLGYMIAYAVAADNLRLGRTVVADSVNALAVTRDAWRAVAEAGGSPSIEVEVICSDRAEHRRRVESRVADIPGHIPPTWAEVEAREHHAWTREHIVIDTAGGSLETCLAELMAALPPS
jgi:predicted kinase